MGEPSTCYQCGKNLLAWAASDLFCNQDCQRLWHEKQNPLGPIQEVGGARVVTAIAHVDDGQLLNAENPEAAAKLIKLEYQRGTRLAEQILPVPTEPAPPLEVLVDAPTLVDPTPEPGYLRRAVRRLFG